MRIEWMLIAQATVVGVFGGVGLALTSIYSRRGPLIYLPYAALLTALTLLLSRHSEIPFGQRYMACLWGFLVASLMHYGTVTVLAERVRVRLVAERRLRRLPPLAWHSIGLAGHAWRLAFLLAIGGTVSAAAAFVSI